MTRVRRRFDAEFKTKVAVEAIRGRKTVREIATQYGVHANLVTKWKTQFLVGANALFDPTSSMPMRRSRPTSAKLQGQIERLKLELAWLKEKVAQAENPIRDVD